MARASQVGLLARWASALACVGLTGSGFFHSLPGTGSCLAVVRVVALVALATVSTAVHAPFLHWPWSSLWCVRLGLSSRLVGLPHLRGLGSRVRGFFPHGQALATDLL